jgi:hypothetical protein
LMDNYQQHVSKEVARLGQSPLVGSSSICMLLSDPRTTSTCSRVCARRGGKAGPRKGQPQQVELVAALAATGGARRNRSAASFAGAFEPCDRDQFSTMSRSHRVACRPIACHDAITILRNPE